MVISIFSVKEYREFLRSHIDNGRRGLISRLAEAAQCQRSHISRVLKGQLHLTLDQAFRVTRFFGLDESEANFFMKLVEFERSGDPEYRHSLSRTLQDLRKAHENLSIRLSQPQIGVLEREMLYYSSWHWSAIHILVSIPEFQTPLAISERLCLPRSYVENCLKELEKFGLVAFERDHWRIASGSVHLPKESPLNATQHSNWRARAVSASQMPNDDGIHYTVVQSISQSDFERVKQLILKTIDSYSEISKPSKEEELICFTCDFFRA